MQFCHFPEELEPTLILTSHTITRAPLKLPIRILPSQKHDMSTANHVSYCAISILPRAEEASRFAS